MRLRRRTDSDWRTYSTAAADHESAAGRVTDRDALSEAAVVTVARAAEEQVGFSHPPAACASTRVVELGANASNAFRIVIGN